MTLIPGVKKQPNLKPKSVTKKEVEFLFSFHVSIIPPHYTPTILESNISICIAARCNVILCFESFGL